MENTEETTKVNLNEVEIKDDNENKSLIEGDPISTDEIIDKAHGSPKAKADISTEKFVEANKEEIDKINWDEVIYENEDKTIPLVTKEDQEVYQAIASEFVGDMDLDTWIYMAKQEINEYQDLKKRENELLDTEKSYFEALGKTAQSSKELLALIQTQAKELRKEFVDNKIAETTIKAAVLKTLHDFIIKRYPIIVDKEERIKAYDEEILKTMFVVPIFKQSVERSLNRLKESNYNRFEPDNINQDAFDYSATISTYVKNIEVKENLDIAAIISKDFEFMNFFVITVLYSVFKYGDKDFVTKTIQNIDEKTLASLDETMNPGNNLKDVKYAEISKKVFNILDNLINNPNIIENISNSIEKSLISDRHIKSYKKLNPEFDYYQVLQEMLKHLPTIQGENIGSWNSYYRSIRKLNLYFSYKELFELGQKEGVKSENYKSAAFNIIIKFMKYDYEHHYTSLITDFVDFLDTSINAKDTRSIFFKTCMNELNAIHSFGFKSTYNREEGENVAPKIYDLAKHRLGKVYDSTVVDEKDDILLKDVNLDDVKVEYSKIVLSSLESFEFMIKNIYN